MPSLVIESGEWNDNGGRINIDMVPLYNISNNASTNEGTPISIFLTTELVPDNTTLYWSLSRPEDFSTGSGSFIVNNNAGSFSLSPTNDFATEGDETVIVYIRTGSQAGPVVIQTSFLLADTSLSPTYTVTAPDAINEGDSISFSVTTTNVPNGTTLYFTIDGTVSSADFSGAPTLSGPLTITSGAASYNLVSLNDVSTEGAETMIFNLRTGSISGTIVATKTSILRDTSQAPSYAITPTVSQISEGGGISFNVGTTGIANGTTLYYSVSSTAINDVSPIAGSITISGNAATIPITAIADGTTEGSEFFNVTLRSVSTSGPVLATSALVEILDTSQNPTYDIVPVLSGPPYSANEGVTVSFSVTTTAVPNGTTLFYTTSGTVSTTDFSDNLTTGTFTINNNQGTINRTLSNDFTTEGAESFQILVRTGSTLGSIVAVSGSVNVNDTSLNPTYNSNWRNSPVNEGQTALLDVTTTNVPNGTTLYWTILHNTTNDADFTSTNGSGVVNSFGTATMSVITVEDFLTEGTQNFSLNIRTGSISGSIVHTSTLCGILDTSLTPTVTITPTTTSVNEGSSVTFNVSTTNIPNGTTLYWVNNGTSSSADFTDGINQGTFTITSGAGSVTRTLVNDSTTEGSETIIFAVYQFGFPPSGTLRQTASTVTINDTSVLVFSMSVGFANIGAGGGGGGTTGGGGGGGAFVNGPSFTAQSGVTYNVRVGPNGSGGGTYGLPTVGNEGLGLRGGETQAFGVIARGGGGGGGSYQPMLTPTTAAGRNVVWRRSGQSVAQGGSGGGGGGGGGTLGGAGGSGTFNGGFGRADDVVTNPGHVGGGGGGAGAAGRGARAQGRGTAGDGGAGTPSGVVGPGIIQYAGGGGGGSWGPFFNDRAGFGNNGGGGGNMGLNDGNFGQNGTGGGGGGAGGLAFNTQFRGGGNGGDGAVLINYTNTFPNLATISGLAVSGASPDTTSRPGSKVYRFVSGNGSIRW